MLRTIFAVVPAPAAAAPLLQAFQALPLGENAKLVGLHVAPFAPSYGLATDLAIGAYIEAQTQAIEEEMEAAKAAFVKACEAAGISYDWRSQRAIEHLVSPQTGALARAADLVLFPQLRDGTTIARHQVEDLIAAAGRPVLGIPQGWSGERLGRRVLIAWDGGREAARAVFDAMPILLKSEAVRIVSVEGHLDEPVRQFTPGDDIAATLSRHGIAAESTTFRGSGDTVKEDLRRQTMDFGADLTVMGCYGHSRFREMILGGVTREMLSEIPFPLLMAS